MREGGISNNNNNNNNNPRTKQTEEPHAGENEPALQAVAATLASHVRESDVVGRLGGDEFAVILVQVDRSAAQAKADSLKQRIEASPAIHDGMAVPLRVSHGLRMFEPGITAAGLLAGADAAMFLNKPPTR